MGTCERFAPVGYYARYGGLTLSTEGYEQHDDDMCDLMFHAAKIGRENDTAKFAGQTTRKTDR